MKPGWRDKHIVLLDRVKGLLDSFKGELLPDYSMVIGMRSDFFLKTDNAAYIVEVKGQASGDYLSFATWGQMNLYKKLVEEWSKSEVPVIPILITNGILTADLRTAFEKSKIAVVEVQGEEDPAETQQKLRRELEHLGFPVPQVKSGSAAK